MYDNKFIPKYYPMYCKNPQDHHLRYTHDRNPKIQHKFIRNIIICLPYFFLFAVYLTTLSVSPDNTVSNNWIIMKGQGYGRQWSWPNLHEREKTKKYQSYVPDQIQNRLLQNTSEHYFFSQLAL